MIKKVILDILDYMRYQVESDKCTLEEMQSIYKVLTDGMHVDATVKDMADHYRQSESNVRNAIARGYVGKPKRRVYYDLMRFMKRIPDSWRRNA